LIFVQENDSVATRNGQCLFVCSLIDDDDDDDDDDEYVFMTQQTKIERKTNAMALL